MVHTSLGSIFQRLPWHSNGGHVCCSVGKQNSASLGPCLTHVLRVSLWLWLRLVTMQDRQKIMFNCLFKKNLLYWSITDLQFYASFCTAKWISYIFTYIYINIYLYIYILFSYFFFACCFNFCNVVLVSVIWRCESATIIHRFPPHSIPLYHHRVPAWVPCAQQKLQPLWRTVWRFLKNLEISLPYYPAVSLLGIYPEKTRAKKRHMYPNVHCNTIYNS